MNLVVWLLVIASQVVLTFADPAIDESSGLVDLGDLMVTINDSGGEPVVYAVDPATGRTVGRTRFADRVIDTEALAPDGTDGVWVGDIGDNLARREYVTVYRVPVSTGDTTVAAPAYRLVYPDGPRDAEALVVDDGRVYVISKGLLGGTVYAAPRRLRTDRVNRLREIGTVAMWVTDAALFPDGRHVLVRSYGDAAVLTFPDLTPVGRFDLPEQKQGEGVSIGPDGRIRLSSEGAHSEVLQIALPDAFRDAMAEPTTAAASPAAPTASAEPARRVERPAATHGDRPLWIAGSLAVLSFGVLVVWLGFLLRRAR